MDSRVASLIREAAFRGDSAEIVAAVMELARNDDTRPMPRASASADAEPEGAKLIVLSSSDLLEVVETMLKPLSFYEALQMEGFRQAHRAIVDEAWAKECAGIQEEAQRFLGLAFDLRTLCIEGSPDSELASAPILERWHVTSRPAFCLTGEVTGHPLLPGTRRRIATSDLVILSEERGWARTRSRWYRLGAPRGVRQNG